MGAKSKKQIVLNVDAEIADLFQSVSESERNKTSKERSVSTSDYFVQAINNAEKFLSGDTGYSFSDSFY
jgi:hypothetical protein